MHFRVFYLNIAGNIYKHIPSCSDETKWAIIVLSVSITFFRTRDFYEQIEMNFTSLFARFAYRNAYIDNLINNFSRHIYSHLIVDASSNNIILSFNCYLYKNPPFYTVFRVVTRILQAKRCVHIFKKKRFLFSFLFFSLQNQLVRLKS